MYTMDSVYKYIPENNPSTIKQLYFLIQSKPTSLKIVKPISSLILELHE